MRPLDRAILGALALGIWALAAVQLLGPLAASPGAQAQDSRLDIPQPAPAPALAPDVPPAPEIQGQVRAAISGCRVRGDVTGARLDAIINC